MKLSRGVLGIRTTRGGGIIAPFTSELPYKVATGMISSKFFKILVFNQNFCIISDFLPAGYIHSCEKK